MWFRARDTARVSCISYGKRSGLCVFFMTLIITNPAGITANQRGIRRRTVRIRQQSVSHGILSAVIDLTLTNIEPGESARVLAIDLDSARQHRLRALGMIPGTQVTVLQKKRSGTLVINLRGTRFALGSAMADQIGVEYV